MIDTKRYALHCRYDTPKRMKLDTDMSLNLNPSLVPQALTNFSRKLPMKRFDQQCLRDYVMDGFRDTGNGIELKCAPESEAHTYMAGYETYHRNINNQLKEIQW